MRIDVAPNAEEAARRAASYIAAAMTEALQARGRAVMALSGGSSAPPLLRQLAGQRLDWSAVHVFQVDERVAPEGDIHRNLTAVLEHLVKHGPLPFDNLHAIEVGSVNLALAVADYQRELEAISGDPPMLDVIHLGLGIDGHTASLFPGDRAVETLNQTVAESAPQSGYRRVTLTLPVLNRAGSVVWLVTGSGKAAVLAHLIAGKCPAPAGRVARDQATVFADQPAAANLPQVRPAS